MSSTREKPNPYKLFGIASGITFLSYIYLKINGQSLILLPIIFIVFLAIALSITLVIMKLELDPQGYNRSSLKGEVKLILYSLGCTKEDIVMFFAEVKTLDKQGKPYMRDLVESYYTFVTSKKMSQDEWFKKFFPGE